MYILPVSTLKLVRILLTKLICVCQMIISNPIHKNTTPEKYSFVYYYFPTKYFGRSIRPSYGTGYKYINGEVCYRWGLSFTM